MEGTGRSSSRRRAFARIALSVLLGVWFAITLTFVLFHTRIDGSSLLEGLPASAQAELRQELGLDRSLPDQYLSFIGDVVRGDLGNSLVNQEPVIDVVRPVVVRSLALMGSAVLIAFIVARVLAVAAVRRPNGRLDRSVMAGSAALASIPFQYVLFALLIFGVYEIEVVPLPAAFRSDPTATGWAAAWDVIRHSALLAIAIAVSMVGRFTLEIRAHILDRLEWTGENPRSRRARSRAFLATLGTSLRAVAARVGFIVSALVVVESIAGWPGAGSQFSAAIGNADYPVVQGLFLVLTVFAVAVACAVRRRWPFAWPADTLSSPIRNRAVRAGLVLSGVWIAFALLAPVILPSEQRTFEWGAQHGAIWAPPFGTCDGAFPSCPAGEHHFWLLGTDRLGVSNLAIAWEDRSRLGSVAWATVLGAVVGGAIGMLAGASPRVLGRVLGWLVDAVAAVPFVLAAFALQVVPHGDDAPKVALALIGAGLVARPVARAWRAAGVGRRLRALAAGGASLASFVFFATAVLSFSIRRQGNEFGTGLGWFRLGLHAVNAAVPVLGMLLVAHGLSARRRSLFHAGSA